MVAPPSRAAHLDKIPGTNLQEHALHRLQGPRYVQGFGEGEEKGLTCIKARSGQGREPDGMGVTSECTPTPHVADPPFHSFNQRG